MFNEGQKNAYLKGELDRRVGNRQMKKWLTDVILKETQADEEKYGKDLGEWTVAEILTYYKKRNTASLNSLCTLHSQLKAYAGWCLDNNLLPDNQNHYAEIDVDVLKTCVNVGLHQQGIITSKELSKISNELLNARDQCLIYAFFEGIQGKQFGELIDLNINQLEGNKLHLATRTIEVSDKFVELMKESSEEYDYYAYGETERKLPFHADDPNVFKMTANSIQSTPIRKRQRLYTNLMRIKGHTGNPAINATSLMESGRIDMVKKLMGENPELDVEEVLQKYKTEISNKYGPIRAIKSYLNQYGRYYTEG